MKKNIISLIIFALVLSVAGFSSAAETVYVKGTVTSYEAGKNITVQDEEGQRHSFQVSENTIAEEGLKSGVSVEVESTEGKADYITVLSMDEESSDEAPAEDEPSDEKPKE